ncbi:MAG: UvrD-helicase domain-containing protein, partial [Propionibacteriaceae bacterium]|nr:UvrD-helicase domain-containing protein [Propionibacteriaceae bacterium]
PVVLVDEFQDTDPEQWAILKRTFVEAGATITLIGDPKQSIYGFRSADLRCYAEAKRIIKHCASLPENYRSEPEVTAGIEALFGNVYLGDGVQLTPVVSAYGAQPQLRLPGAPEARLWLRGLGPEATPDPDQAVADDMVAQIRGLLAGGSIQGAGGERPLGPQDIAVLTRTRERGLTLVAQLRAAGLPAVWHGPAAALEPRAVAEWQAVLAAVAQPTRASILAAGLGSLLGCDAVTLLSRQDETPGSQRIHELADSYERGGAAALIGDLLAGLQPRLAEYSDGDEVWAELAVVGETLLTADVPDLGALQTWLAARAKTVGELPTRLARDEPAVRVSTMHSAKGLEFPVVLLPQVSVTELNLRTAFPYVNSAGDRVLHVGARPGIRDELTAIARRQAREEELRLLYVGLSRAKHLAIVWHVMDKRATAGPLTALLSRDRLVPELRPEYPRLPASFDFGAAVHLSSALAPAWGHDLPPRPARQPTAQLRLSTFGREIDQAWRRTSYTGLTAGLHEQAPDEPEDLTLIPEDLTGHLAEPSPMNELPSGARFGTLIHAVLEELDWNRPEHTAQVVARRAPAFGLSPEQGEQLVQALGKVITTPLGGLLDGALSDLPVSHRLPELDFDLPLGDRGPAALVADLAEALADHLPTDDPLAAYPQRLLATPASQASLRGFLTGSIDAVLQLPRGGFAVVDYKTNRLPTLPDQELAVGHYTPAAMAEAMMQAQYPLQALLYCAALHRYLAWRLPGYDPATHLGGVGYLFVRGMAGPETPQVGGGRCGVFEWYPPTALVVEVSELLGGHRG